MLPRTISVWQRDSQPTASGKPGAVQTSSGYSFPRGRTAHSLYRSCATKDAKGLRRAFTDQKPLASAGVEFTNGDEPGVKLKATKARGGK